MSRGVRDDMEKYRAREVELADLARDIFLADNWRMPKPAAIEDWDALAQSTQRGETYAHNIARRLFAAGYRKAQP